jgi:hypothetical protein
MTDAQLTFSHDRFLWIGAERRFSAEASTLGWKPGQYARNFYIIGKTKKKVLFMLRSADEVAFTYTIDPHYATLNPELKDVSVVVFNT